MQEISILESTSMEELMTLRVCDGVINCIGIHIDLFEVNTSTVAQKTVHMFPCFALNHPNTDNS